MTETEPRSRNRALVASFLFTDLVGYSKGTAAEQYVAKATLSEILSRNLAMLRKDDYRIKDTGDGALIAFLANPEHALYMALAIAHDFALSASPAGFRSNSLRTGLHIGAVKEAIDLEERPNFVGDGINAAKRIMDFAAPGQITASRSYFEAVSWLDSAYAALFQHLGASDDKHGRAHELYAIHPNADVLEKLRQDLLPAQEETQEPDPLVTSAAKSIRRSTSKAVDGVAGTDERPRAGVRRWVVPIGALVAAALASIYLTLRPTERPIAVTAHPASGDAVLPTPRPAGPAAPLPADSAPAPDPPPSKVPMPGTDVGMSTGPLPGRTEDAAPAAISRPAPKSPSDGQTPGVDGRRKASASVPATSPVPIGQRSARCQLIMEKATLGEPLSQDEKRELASSCR